MAHGSQVEKAAGRGPKAPGADCENCPLQHRPFVPTTGPDTASIFILGEAPGEVEAKQGKPFVGPSGRLLDQLLMMNGIRRADVAVGNVVSCHPLGNQDPPKEAIAACRGYLDGEIQRRPTEKVFALGKFAAQQALESRNGILKLRVGPPKDSLRWPGVSVVPSIHPAATFRNGDWYPHLVSDTRKLVGVAARWIEPQYWVVDDPERLLRWLHTLAETTDLFVDAEWAPDTSLLAIGIAWAPDRVLVVRRGALSDREAARLLGDFLASRRLSFHFGRADVPVLRNLRSSLRIGGDSLLASYTLDERTGIHNLDWCSQEHLGAPEWKSAVEQYVKDGDYSKVPEEILYKYNAWDTAAGYQLLQYFERRIRDEGLWDLYQYMIRVSNMLMEVEIAGLEIDMENLEHLEQHYQGKLDALEAEFARMQLNPRSPKQITQHLAAFGITTGSTDVAHLTDILGDLKGEKKRDATHSKYHINRRILEPKPSSYRDSMIEFIERMLNYRKNHKMYATYVKGVRERLVD